VYANDLNPRSYHFLQENTKLNKCTSKVLCFNLDGRDFIRLIIVGSNQQPPLKHIDHIIMNLPASAIEFLDVFRGLFLPGRPIIHCYGFSTAEEGAQDLVEQAEHILGTKIATPTVSMVRLVAPKKRMLRRSFVLPLQVDDNTPTEEPVNKKRKTENT